MLQNYFKWLKPRFQPVNKSRRRRCSTGSTTLIGVREIEGRNRSNPNVVQAASSHNAPSTLSSPIITKQPAKVTTVQENNVVTLSAIATGNPHPKVQWQLSSDGGKTFFYVIGATSPTYTFTAEGKQNGDHYRAIFSNSMGSATTDAATITVLNPSDTADPSNSEATGDQAIEFMAFANGNPSPTIHWQVSTDGGVSWKDLPFKTSDKCRLWITNAHQKSQFRAAFSNSHDTVSSNGTELLISESFYDRYWSGILTGAVTAHKKSPSSTGTLLPVGQNTLLGVERDGNLTIILRPIGTWGNDPNKKDRSDVSNAKTVRAIEGVEIRKMFSGKPIADLNDSLASGAWSIANSQGVVGNGRWEMKVASQ